MSPARATVFGMMSLLLVGIVSAMAQDSGQICLRAFQDGDGAPIVHGIAAAAIDKNGVTLSTGLLDDSPFAAEGIFCLGPLPAGDYRLLLSSSAFSAPAGELTARVQPGAPPPLLEVAFRARAPADSGGEAAPAPAASAELLALALAGVSALLLLLSLLGALVGFILLRRGKLTVFDRKRGRA